MPVGKEPRPDPAVAERRSASRAPRDLRVTPLRFGAEELRVLSFALEEGVLEALPPAVRAVAEDVIAGRTNAEIAGRRGTSVRTVANQVGCLLRRLGVGSRAELASRLLGLPGGDVPNRERRARKPRGP